MLAVMDPCSITSDNSVLECNSFLIFQSIHRHSVAAKHSSCIVLKVFDGLQSMMYRLTTKAGSLNIALFWCKQKAEQP
jgi:hypothetical protein